MSVESQVITLIVATFALRVLFAASMGLGVDESYTVATSRYLDFSYFDHPPVAWWLSWAATHLGARHNPPLLRLPFLALFAASTWLMYQLAAYLFGRLAGLWAAICMNLAPVFAVSTGSWILPDGPLIAAMLASSLCMAHSIFGTAQERRRAWILAGAFAGLALLSKYHGVFLLFGAGLFLATQRHYRQTLLRFEPYLAALIVLALFLPVIVWNGEHSWVSFRFQGERAGPAILHLLGPVTALAGQALFLTPWIWLPLVVTGVSALSWGPSRAKEWFLCCLAIGPIAVFTVVPLWTNEKTLFHWAAPGYLFLIPLLGAKIADRMVTQAEVIRKWAIASAVILISLIIATAGEFRFGWIESLWPSFAQDYPFVEGVDWTDVKRAVAARGFSSRRGFFIAGTKWNATGKLDYALDGAIPVVCLCESAHEYSVLDKTDSLRGLSGLIVAQHLDVHHAQSQYGKLFRSIRELHPIEITHAGHTVLTLAVYLGEDYRPSSR
jgi:4-amino-4-deoxy-L-arabinose transferase-like glycosyltransferase